MRQLDLFGSTQEESTPAIKAQVEDMPVNATTKAEKAEKIKTGEPAPKEEEESLVAAFVQTTLPIDTAEVTETTTPPPQDNVVFSDNNIKVKIKVKAVKQEAPATPVQTDEITASAVVEEPVAETIPAVATAQPVETVPEPVAEEVAPVVVETKEEEITPAPQAEEAITEAVEATVETEPSIEAVQPEIAETTLVETEKAIAEITTPIEPVQAVTTPVVATEEVIIQQEEPAAPPKKLTTVIKPEENKILAPVVPKPAVRKTPPPAAANKKRGRKSFKEIDAEVDLVNVPDDDALFQKQYYPISTVATWFNVNTSLLRYWENEFDILKPRKNRKGDRLFRPEDVKSLQTIYYLLRQRKFTIEGAKEYLKSNKRKVDLNAQLVQSLSRFRSFLLELKANL